MLLLNETEGVVQISEVRQNSNDAEEIADGYKPDDSNGDGLNAEFEDKNFANTSDIDEDFKLLHETQNAEHRYWLSDYAIGRVRKNQNYIILITGQVGCQPEGSKVLMADGSWKEIQDIEMGDEVISPQHDGSRITSKVIQTHRDYSDKCYDVINSNGDVLYSCSNNHKIPHIDGQSKELKNITAEKLSGEHLITFNSNMDEMRVQVMPRESSIVYGFHLDSPDRWYITDNEMITHNSGKSYSGLALAEDIDPYFNIDRVIFHPKEFINLLDMGLPKGSVVLWEEVGVTLSSRDWFKEQNKIISSLFETFRRHNLILIMTVPNVQFIDSRIRSMIHGYGEMLDPTYTGGEFGWMKYFHVVVNLRNGKIMHRYPRVRDDDGKVHVIQGNRRESGNMFFALPSDDILKPYEQKKFEFVKWQQESGLSKFNPKEVVKNLEIGDMIKIMTGNPRKHKLGSKKGKDDDDNKESLTNIIEHNWVLFKLEYPNMKLKKNDVSSAVRFVLNSFDYEFKQGDHKLKNEELHAVWELQQIFGKNHKAIANSLNTTPYMLKQKMEEWESNGMWSAYVEGLEEVEVIEGYSKDKRKAKDGNENATNSKD